MSPNDFSMNSSESRVEEYVSAPIPSAHIVPDTTTSSPVLFLNIPFLNCSPSLKSPPSFGYSLKRYSAISRGTRSLNRFLPRGFSSAVSKYQSDLASLTDNSFIDGPRLVFGCCRRCIGMDGGRSLATSYSRRPCLP